LKKVLKDGALLTGDLRETFSEYYNKCFVPIKKKPNNYFVFFKYYTDYEKEIEESEDSESGEESNKTKDLLLKKIELMFEKGYSFTDIKKLFPTFCAANTERINLLYTQVLEVRFNKDQH
jgi:hypothetical protein